MKLREIALTPPIVAIIVSLASALSPVDAVAADWTGEPDFYVTYIAATSGGNQYIDLGIVGKTGVKMETDMMWSSDITGDISYMGARKGDVRYYPLNANGSKWSTGYSVWQKGSTDITAGKKYHVVSDLKAGSQTIVADGTKVHSKSQSGTVDTGLNLYLFAINYNGTASNFSVARCYGLTIWDADGTAHVFSPCVKNGEACLYDGQAYYCNQSATPLKYARAIDTVSDLPADGVFDVADGQTVDVNVGISDGDAPLRVIKKGAGCINFNAANTFTGGLELQAGYINVYHAEALGNGRVYFSTTAQHQLSLNVSGAIFTNDFVVLDASSSSSGHKGANSVWAFSDLAISKPCTLSGDFWPDFSGTSKPDNQRTFSIGGRTECSSSSFGIEDLGGTVDFTGDLDFTGHKAAYLRLVSYGTFVFHGCVKSHYMNMSGASTSNGAIKFLSSENNLGDGHAVSARTPFLYCGAANVLGNLYWYPQEMNGYRNGNIDLCGFDQRIVTIVHNLGAGIITGFAANADDKDISIVMTAADKPATLTWTGRGANQTDTTWFGFSGATSLVLDADPTYTLIQTNRLNKMTGALVVSNGVFRIGAHDSFAKIGELRVEAGARLEVATELIQAFGSCTNFVLNGTCVVTDNDLSPFAVETVALTLGPNASLSLPADAELSVASLATVSAGGEIAEHGPGFYGPGGKLSNLIKSGKVKVPATVKTTATWTGLGADTGIATGENWTTSPDAPDLELGSLKAVFASGGEFATVDRAVSLNGLAFAPVAETTGFTLANDGGSLAVGEQGVEIAASEYGVERTYAVEVPLSFDGVADRAFTIPSDDTLAFAGGVTALGSLTPSGGRLVLGGTNVVENRLVVRDTDLTVAGTLTMSGDDWKGTDLYNNEKSGILSLKYVGSGGVSANMLTYTNAVVDKGQYITGPSTGDSDVWFKVQGTNVFKRSTYFYAMGNANLADGAKLTFEGGMGASGAVVFRSGGQATVVVTNRPIYAVGGSGVRLMGGVELVLAAPNNKFTQSYPMLLYYNANNTLRFACDYALNDVYLQVNSKSANQRVEFGATKQKVTPLNSYADPSSYAAVFNGEAGSELEVTKGGMNSSVTGALSIRKTGDGDFRMTTLDKNGTGHNNLVWTSAGDLTAEGGLFRMEAGVTWQNGTNVTAKGTGRLVVCTPKAFNKKLTVMHIEDEGVLELANDGSVSVKELWLDGERIAPGTYGASLASTPAELKAHLDGAGLLRVCGGGFAIIVR